MIEAERGEPLLLHRVTVYRGQRAVLDGLDASFEVGFRHVIVGASGSGKTTLLRLLNRLEDPARGVVRLGERPLSSWPVQELRRQVGLVPQAARPFPGTVRENLVYPAQVRREAPPARAALEAALVEMGLDPGSLERPASSYSGGEQQRLAVAVALLAGPEILALDEPTAALDPEAARWLAEALARRTRETGLRTIVVCHQRTHAAWLGDRVHVLESGRMLRSGTTALLREEPIAEGVT